MKWVEIVLKSVNKVFGKSQRVAPENRSIKWAEIVLKSVDYANSTFEPGSRANPNWIAMILYKYQSSDEDPVSELEEDIVWAAEKIEPDRSKWQISPEEYEVAINSKDCDPHGRRKRIRDLSL